jgi:hypothetical protein
MSNSTTQSIYSPAAPRLWFRLVIAPGIWAIQAATNYVLVPNACKFESASIAMHVVSLGALLALALVGLAARHRYKQISVESREADPDFWTAERWVPAAGFILAAAFFIVILAQTIPTFIVQRCA